MDDETPTEKAARARRRALRAAQVVTMSAVLMGCSMSHGNTDAGRETDAGPMVTDAGYDAGGDDECLTYEDAQESQECCESDRFYGWWEDGNCLIAVEGPRVPPPMTA